MPADALHVRGVLLPDGEQRDLYVVDGRLTFRPVPGAETIAGDGFVLPGLVDAHCHIGLGTEGGLGQEQFRHQALTESRAGALLVRDAGSPVDTRVLDGDPEAPRIIRAGRHVARPKRYVPRSPSRSSRTSCPRPWPPKRPPGTAG